MQSHLIRGFAAAALALGLLIDFARAFEAAAETPETAPQAVEAPLTTDERAAQDVANFRLHNDTFTIITFLCIALALIVASASGIGGGGILVGWRAGELCGCTPPSFAREAKLAALRPAAGSHLHSHARRARQGRHSAVQRDHSGGYAWVSALFGARGMQL